jgi:uncharacterized protein (DUF1330 family)
MAKKGYWVVSYKSVKDPAALAEYKKLAGVSLEAAGGRVIVAAEPTRVHESGINQQVVIVEFDDVRKAIAAYETDSYKQALRALGNAVERDFRIVEAR